MSERLATEFISAANNEGGAIKRRKMSTEWQKPIGLCSFQVIIMKKIS